MPRGLGVGDEEGRSGVNERWQLVGRHEELARALDALRNRTGVGCGDPWRRRRRQVAPGGGIGGSRRARRSRRCPGSCDRGLGDDALWGVRAPAPAGCLDCDDPVDRYREIVEGLPAGMGGSWCTSTIFSISMWRPWACSPSSWTAVRCSWSQPCAPRRPRIRSWPPCGGVMTWCGSISPTSVGMTSTRCSTSCSAGLSIPTRWRRSGRRARAMPCSCVSSCSAHAIAAIWFAGVGSGGCGDRSRARRG